MFESILMIIDYYYILYNSTVLLHTTFFSPGIECNNSTLPNATQNPVIFLIVDNYDQIDRYYSIYNIILIHFSCIYLLLILKVYASDMLNVVVSGLNFCQVLDLRICYQSVYLYFHEAKLRQLIISKGLHSSLSLAK
jgi:hypothetical protein